MSATAEVTLTHHEQVLQRFIEDVRPVEQDMAGFVLFGTAGRGGLIPGESDLMDAYCFLRHEVFDDKKRFFKVLDVLARGFERIAKTAQFPFHPFFYWDERDPVPAHFKREMTAFSTIILGKDVRPNIYTTEASRLVGRTSFFEIRRLGAPRMVFLHKQELTLKECDAMYAAILITIKHMPMSACMALDRWPGLPEGVEELKRLMPDLDTGVLDRIADYRLKPDRMTNVESLRSLLRESMEFIEDVNNRLLARRAQ